MSRPPTITDERVARRLLERVAERVPGGALLWRGDDLSGSDVDLLALPGAEAELAHVLAAEGLVPEPREPGRVIWSTPGARLDVTSAAAWPRHYPSLPGLAGRARSGSAPLAAASPEDVLLVLAADAVAGRPLDRLLRRIRPLAAAADHARVRELARRERAGGLPALVADPDRLAARARRGRLPYRHALAAAARSRRARAALRVRLARRARRGASSPSGSPRPRAGRLIALSGMDGSGKSTAARAVAERFAEAGLPVEIAWARLGVEELRDRVARPFKRVLRYRGAVADPVAASPAAERPPDTGAGRGGPSPIGWVWVPVVAAITAYSHRRAARVRRDGTTVVCDRWLVDSLVDLRVRYGRHRLAELVLRLGTPRPDLGILLELDAGRSAERKPGDQVERILRSMESLYDELGLRHSLTIVDARPPREEVEARVRALAEPLCAGLTSRG